MPAEPSIGKHTPPNDYLDQPRAGSARPYERACPPSHPWARWQAVCQGSPSRLAGVVPPPIASAKRAMVSVHCLTTAAVYLRLPVGISAWYVTRVRGYERVIVDQARHARGESMVSFRRPPRHARDG